MGCAVLPRLQGSPSPPTQAMGPTLRRYSAEVPEVLRGRPSPAHTSRSNPVTQAQGLYSVLEPPLSWASPARVLTLSELRAPKWGQQSPPPVGVGGTEGTTAGKCFAPPAMPPCIATAPQCWLLLLPRIITIIDQNIHCLMPHVSFR